MRAAILIFRCRLYLSVMIRYTPIESGVFWNSNLADLRYFDWQSQMAEWAFPDGKSLVRVWFGAADLIVRILDEFPLSTENEAQERHGLVPHNFAYLVEGDPFLTSQSKVWRELDGPVQHYCFLTGNGCMDAITSSTPRFEIIG